MSLSADRRAAALAEARCVQERSRWLIDSQAIRSKLRPHREAWIVGGGFLTGVVAGLLPLSGMSRVGGAFGNIVAIVLRSPLVAILFDGIARPPSADDVSPADAAPATPDEAG